jgi:hypothetical protein
VQDLAEFLGPDAGRLTLLTDAMSPVPGFEALQEAFLAGALAKGLGFATTETAFG